MILVARSEDKLLKAQKEVAKRGSHADIYSCDLSKDDDSQKLIDAINKDLGASIFSSTMQDAPFGAPSPSPPTVCMILSAHSTSITSVPFDSFWVFSRACKSAGMDIY